ncbi:hypothetical protein C0Q70_05734 [Pomacea canaliculata]|uniref:Uncharacterized protein n=1 Tax=Pomacea canaliculata TaxID=400727 RepID=A0A2T7PM09_POMCA|nr:hypothetical protein C0Q70_05734 [Pomacea canaliculata]
MQRVPRYGCQGLSASVSQNMSPEGRLAMLASRKESRKAGQKIQPKAHKTASTPTTSAEVTQNVNPFDPKLSGLLDGYITSMSCVCQRVLGGGDRLHNALEVVEIVRHRDCDEEDNNNNDSDHSDDDDEEVIQRKANLSSLERCLVWVELHQFVHDRNHQSSATCSGS